MAIDYAEVARLAKKGRRAERRAEAIRGFIRSMLTAAVSALTDGWLLMLAVGIAHHAWVHQLPTIGYWWSCLLVWLLRGVFSRLSNSSKKD